MEILISPQSFKINRKKKKLEQEDNINQIQIINIHHISNTCSSISPQIQHSISQISLIIFLHWISDFSHILIQN